MPLDPKLKKILACPNDQADLTYHKKGKQETLTCKKCKQTFKVESGVPILLPKEQ